MLQAEQQLFPAELTLAQYRAQVFSAAVSIYKAMGGGWVTLAEEMTSTGAAVRAQTAAGPQAGPTQ